MLVPMGTSRSSSPVVQGFAPIDSFQSNLYTGHPSPRHHSPIILKSITPPKASTPTRTSPSSVQRMPYGGNLQHALNRGQVSPTAGLPGFGSPMRQSPSTSSDTLGSGSVRSPSVRFVPHLTMAQSPALVVSSTPDSADMTDTGAGALDTATSVGAVADEKLSTIMDRGGAVDTPSSILLREEVLSPSDMARLVPIVFAAVRHNKFETVEKMLRDAPK